MRFLPLSLAWLQALVRPVCLAWGGLVGVALLALVSQALVRLPVVPDLGGVLLVAIGLLPEVAGLMLPVALFFATVGLTQRWAEGGELAAMYAAGLGGRRLLPAILLAGGLGGAAVGGLAHGLAPAGRTLVRQTIAQSSATLQLQAGRPTWMGDTMLLVGASQGDQLSEVFLAQGDVVATAPRATVSSDGVVALQDGHAQGLGSEPWTMQFAHLRVPVRVPPPRVHAFDMSGTRLQDLISRMESLGRSPHAERLVLLKRTTLSLGTPLLVLLAVPLGVLRRWAVPAAVGSVLGLWAVQRLGDHLAGTWGAVPSALLPLAALAVAVVLTWARWWDR
jgi:lipopolysaccharide export LptBFGC system permease protein LptF